MTKIRQQEIKAGQEAKQSEVQAKIEIAKEDREDGQAHDKEMELIRNEGKKEVEALKGAMKATQDFQNNMGKAAVEREKSSVTNPFES